MEEWRKWSIYSFNIKDITGICIINTLRIYKLNKNGCFLSRTSHRRDKSLLFPDFVQVEQPVDYCIDCYPCRRVYLQFIGNITTVSGNWRQSCGTAMPRATRVTLWKISATYLKKNAMLS